MRFRDKTTGKQLLRASWRALQEDRSLLLLPVLAAVFSVIAATAIIATGAVLGASLVVFSGGAADSGETVTLGPAWWILTAVMAYVTTAIAVFFQVALAAGAMERLDGGDPSIGSCVRKASERLPQILLWSAISTTVGVILRAITERGGIFGVLVGALGGVAWAVMTFFVVPIVLVEGRGGWSAITRSKDLMVAKWGKVGRSSLRFGFVFLGPAVLCFLAIAGGVALIAGGVMAGIGLLAGGVIGVLVVALLANATMTYLRTVLYRYAMGLPVPGIDESVLASAVAVKS